MVLCRSLKWPKHVSSHYVMWSSTVFRCSIKESLPSVSHGSCSHQKWSEHPVSLPSVSCLVFRAFCCGILTPSAEVPKQWGLKRELSPGRIIPKGLVLSHGVSELILLTTWLYPHSSFSRTLLSPRTGSHQFPQHVIIQPEDPHSPKAKLVKLSILIFNL